MLHRHYYFGVFLFCMLFWKKNIFCFCDKVLFGMDIQKENKFWFVITTYKMKQLVLFSPPGKRDSE